ncbi:hypothetical protein KAR91_00700 [Candidatus Pacearchaeota archaeon]|nr:hypothetical protein [Candidatus Pacearchaeota archaeon]
MKLFISILSLLFLAASCSPFGSSLTGRQSEYVKEIIVCDSKNVDYKILTDEDDIEDFFNDDGHGDFSIKYEYKRSKVVLSGEIVINKLVVNGNEMFQAKFKRLTFPGSACRKLKSGWRNF